MFQNDNKIICFIYNKNLNLFLCFLVYWTKVYRWPKMISLNSHWIYIPRRGLHSLMFFGYIYFIHSIFIPFLFGVLVFINAISLYIKKKIQNLLNGHRTNTHIIFEFLSFLIANYSFILDKVKRTIQFVF